jgi:hypothetical protein
LLSDYIFFFVDLGYSVSTVASLLVKKVEERSWAASSVLADPGVFDYSAWRSTRVSRWGVNLAHYAHNVNADVIMDMLMNHTATVGRFAALIVFRNKQQTLAARFFICCS